MKPPRSISVVLSLVLALMAVPAMGDCAMAEAAAGHASPAVDIDRDGDSDSGHCHDPAPSPERAQTLDCPDCFERCPLQSQAALLAAVRAKFAVVAQPELPPSGKLHPADAAPQLFRPPALVPRAHSFKS